jgi:hypothetical protein
VDNRNIPVFLWNKDHTMTNNYDGGDTDRPMPHDLDYPPTAPTRREEDASSVRSRLVGNLRDSMTEAQNLANIYHNLARQLELQIVLVETKR